MKFKHFLLYSLLLFAISCSLFNKARAPKFDAGAEAKVQALTVEVNDLYNSISANANKAYSPYQATYDNITSDISALAAYDSARKHSTAILIIVNDLRSRFATFRQEHINYVKINNAQALAYKEGMDGILDILFRTEANYKP